MPKTIIKLYPLEAVVFFDNGEARTHACCDEADASVWIDQHIMRYGNHVVACDIYPRLTAGE